ncbi:MAG: YCF48-related protein [Candidatus Eiseniibacteriota bacterium]
MRSKSPVRLPLFAVALAGVLAALNGCGDDDNPGPGPAPTYSSIVITDGPDTLLIGQTGQFTFTVLDTAGQPVASPQVAFNSTPTGVVTIDGTGSVRGLSEGTATVRATGGGVTSDSVLVTVFPGYGWVNQSDLNFTLLDLHGVWFVDSREGWAVGDQGVVLHTTDAGTTWESQRSNSTGYTLQSVAFATRTVGVVVGDAGRIIRTVDGGRSWFPVTTDTDGGKGLNDVFFQDDSLGWAVGNAGLILRTVNQGQDWIRLLPGVSGMNLRSVSFPRLSDGSTPLTDDPFQYGWIVGDGGEILASDNYGVNWRRYTDFVTSDHWRGVARAGKTEAIAAGNNNRIALTSASGDSALWALKVPTWAQSNFTAVAWPSDPMVPSLEAWVVGKGILSAQPIVLYTANGGLDWQEQELPSDAPLVSNGIEDVFFIDNRVGWAVGTSGLMLHTASGGLFPPVIPLGSGPLTVGRGGSPPRR